MDQDGTAKIIRTVLAVLAISGGGFAGGEAVDLFDAQEWKAENVERLMQAERDRERMVALEAQAAILIDLVERRSAECDDRPARTRHRDPEPISGVVDEGVDIELDVPPWGVIE
jgi:hypothetical protein